MDLFHVIALAGTALDQCRQRIQQATLGRRGKTRDPLYGARKTLRTGMGLLTDRQREKLDNLFAAEDHVCVEFTWHYYQQMITAYREDNRKTGKIMQRVINDLSQGAPDELTELRRLGATLKRRAGDILAYFKHPHSSNGPTEAINGRLEHLRGIALWLKRLRFLESLGVSQYRLAQVIGVDQARISLIVRGKQSITVDTALRLATFFNATPEFWLRLQGAYDLMVVRSSSDYTRIEPLVA